MEEKYIYILLKFQLLLQLLCLSSLRQARPSKSRPLFGVAELLVLVRGWIVLRGQVLEMLTARHPVFFLLGNRWRVQLRREMRWHQLLQGNKGTIVGKTIKVLRTIGRWL